MRTQRGLGEAIIGIGFVAAGVLFLLSTLDIVRGVEWWRWLPALLVVWGVLQFITSRGQDVFGPALLVVVGAVLLLATTGVIRWNTVWQFWPVVLIIIGLSILVGRMRVSRAAQSSTDPGDTVDMVSILGGNARNLTAQSFKGGDVTALLGGAKLDLRDAQLGDGATLNVTAVMGGVELYVPDDWEVDLSATAVLGGVEDKRRVRKVADGTPARLRVTGLVLMGGVEVKS